MKKLLLIITFFLIFSGCVTIPAGYRGVKVDMLGSGKGSAVEVPAGRYWTIFQLNTKYFNFPVFNQNYVWTRSITEGSETDESFTFSVNGTPISVDIGIEYSLEIGKIAGLFLKYRKNVDELTSITIRNIVRDNFNRLSVNYDIDTLMSGGMTKLIEDVYMQTKNYFVKDGINVKSLSLVSAPTYPASMVAAIEDKNKATQKAIQRENELREVEAEALKQIAKSKANLESAKYQAQANRALSASYSQTLINKMWIEKWNGVVPYMMSDGNNSILITPKNQ